MPLDPDYYVVAKCPAEVVKLFWFFVLACFIMQVEVVWKFNHDEILKMRVYSMSDV